MTKQNIAPRIDDHTQITGTSAGHVRSNWNPNYGYSRKQEIEVARQEALEAQRKEQEAQLPVNMRIAALEREVMRLKEQMKELQK